jgi:16S rRNA G966 N2-methylase RsmD
LNIGWWSGTPEIIAEYTAKLAKNCSVIDGFCGSGGNVIQFSKYCSKVYAIDIDPKKIEICKNNCKVYNCKNNIDFIEYDFLKIEEYKPIKVKADYIFLSPPWGGINYKNSDVYSIKASMTPDISEIIKVCLRITKYIMFYIPRTLKLKELFEIISDINGKKRLFFDIHILKSANKIKALLIIFGHDIDKKVGEKEIDEYLNYVYDYKISEIYIKILSAIAKIIGNYRFLENEISFRKNDDEFDESNTKQCNIGKELFNYFFKLVLTEQEKIKLKSLKIYAQLKAINSNKLNKNNNNKDNKNQEPLINNINNINNENVPNNFIDKYTIIYTGDNNDNYLKLKEKNIEDESLFNIENNLKFSPESVKQLNIEESSEHDEKNILSNSPTPTLSTSPSSSMIVSNTKNFTKLHEEWKLSSCHEINLHYAPK